MLLVSWPGGKRLSTVPDVPVCGHLNSRRGAFLFNRNQNFPKSSNLPSQLIKVEIPRSMGADSALRS